MVTRQRVERHLRRSRLSVLSSVWKNSHPLSKARHMASRVQITRIVQRIEALGSGDGPMQAIISMITAPPGWNTDNLLDRHCQKWPEHRGNGRCPTLRIWLACSRSDPDDYSEVPVGMLGVDDESWRELARAELAAGRDPNLTLAASFEG
jgi:hypothetical protein